MIARMKYSIGLGPTAPAFKPETLRRPDIQPFERWEAMGYRFHLELADGRRIYARPDRCA